MFVGGRYITPSEDIEQIVEEQWECSRKEPTVVSVYFVTEIEGTNAIFIRPHKNFCVFDKKQAIETTVEAYRAWQPIKPVSSKLATTRVEIALGTEFVVEERIPARKPLDTGKKRFLQVVK